MPTIASVRAALRRARGHERNVKQLHTTAQTDLTEARRDDVHPRQPLVDRRDHRSKQLEEARRDVHSRELQLRKAARTAAAAGAAGPERALAEARKYIGKTEDPPGRNTAPWGLAAWIRQFLGLGYGVAWCGIFVGHCLQAAGVAVTGRVASVQAIYDDAGAGRNGFTRRVALKDARPGDVLILFSTSTHTELVEKVVPGGFQTIGGNTSPGNTGSQANGGGCFRRVRPAAAVVAVCRPAYPTKGA